MLKGVYWLKWDFQNGVTIDWHFPETNGMDIKEFKKIYSNQTFGNNQIPRFATFSTEELNIATFFGGRSCTDMIVLLGDTNDNLKAYEKSLLNYYFKYMQGDAKKITNEQQMNENFKKSEKFIDFNSPNGGQFNEKFEIFFNSFTKLIDTLDRRMNQLENLILQLTSFFQEQNI